MERLIEKKRVTGTSGLDPIRMMRPLDEMSGALMRLCFLLFGLRSEKPQNFHKAREKCV